MALRCVSAISDLNPEIAAQYIYSTVAEWLYNYSNTVILTFTACAQDRWRHNNENNNGFFTRTVIMDFF